MSEQQRDFKGIWINKSVWLDERLSAVEKVVLAEIDSLDGENGCYASNEALASFCQCSVSKITKAISKLTSLGYVKTQSFDGRTRVLRGCLVKSTRQTSTKYEADQQKVRGDKIYYKIINNNISSSSKAEEAAAEPADEKCKADRINYQQFADTYNAVCSKLPHCQKVVEKRKEHIRTFLKSFTAEQWKDVCAAANESTFLTGGGKNGWKADFDFLLRPDKATSILEGKYKDGAENGQTQQTGSLNTENYEQEIAAYIPRWEDE